MELTKVLHGEWAGWWSVQGLDSTANSYVKYTVPAQYRVHEDGKWYVHEKYIAGLQQLAGVTPSEDPYVVMHLLPTASQAIIDAVFRTMAKELHPDAGGTSEAFMRLKTAYDKLSAK